MLSEEQVQQFYDFLQGYLHGEAADISWDSPPKLDGETAFSIIYYLQEVMYIIPDKFECCKKCGDIFDSENNGCSAMYCDGCCPYSTDIPCDECPDLKESEGEEGC